jgi:hypothetical protein
LPSSPELVGVTTAGLLVRERGSRILGLWMIGEGGLGGGSEIGDNEGEGRDCLGLLLFFPFLFLLLLGGD